MLAFEEAAAIETRTKVFTKVNILYMRSYHSDAVVLSMVLCLITEFQHAFFWIIVGGTAELSAFFSLAVFCHVHLVYDLIHVIQDDLIGFLSPFNIRPVPTS